mmetsp:Transcript_7986/g.16191  ORF Transcript_7986/g.16191 Transcript_7986/m.16191 type:complete len:551 (-) Transcript_7986:894-2546(-)
MAHNPFDDFADDFRSALPGQQIPGGNPPPPPEAVVHPSTTGSATQSVQLPHFSGHPIPNGNTNGSGIPSNMGMNATAPPHQQQPVIGGPGAPSTGMYFPPQTHQMQPPQPSSALVPSSEGTTPNPYASMLGPPTDQHSQGMASQMSAQDTSSVIQPSPALQGAGNSNPFQAIPSATGPPPAPVAPTGLPVDSSNPFAAPSGPGLVPMPPPSGQVPPAFHDSMSSPSAGLGPTGGANYGVSPGAQSDIQQLPSQHPTSVALNGTGHFDPIAMPTGPPAAVDPFGAAGTQPSAGGNAGALVVASQPVDDPFGVFAAPAVPAQTPVPADTTPPPASDDPWADMGFGPPVPDADTGKSKDGLPTSVSAGEIATGVTPNSSTKAPSRSPGELPPGGEWYDARIFTPTLGVMFFKPQELTDSLFLQTDKALVDALDDRPVVAFIVEGSSARSAGVELGHVLLKVNGIDVKNPKEASRLIKEGPRPLPLLFYVPDTTVVVAEGEHMVKYDTRETGAPNSAKDWKPKYVVIGGIIAQPWMMNMYRSKVSRLVPMEGFG